VRGSVVRYVHLPSQHVDTALLQDATRREVRFTLGIIIESNDSFLSCGTEFGTILTIDPVSELLFLKHPHLPSQALDAQAQSMAGSAAPVAAK
jgi:hypothetical protein